MADSDLDPLHIILKRVDNKEVNEKLAMIVNSLTVEQKNLVYKRYCLRMSVNEIAAEEGVSHSAISHRLKRIKSVLLSCDCKNK